MMTSNVMTAAANNDAELVGATLSGNRDAFSQIVSRYQSLICSLAYSATGNLNASEDLAQETFVAAWKQLANLREPEKLRAWLCGIARNRINNFLRREGREPNHKAESIEEISETHSPEPLPVDHTISNEEQAILWRSLERIPEIYREPLVLFYREHQSIEAVAEKLELTEDNVKQRLSRGRKLLSAEVTAFVEGALERTSPGKNFTLGVIAALPLMAGSAKAATVGVAVVKGGAAAKGVLTAGTLGGLLAMFGGGFITVKAHIDDAKSPRERQFMLQNFGLRGLFSLLLFAGLIASMQLDFFHVPIHFYYSAAAFAFLISIYSSVVLARRIRRRQQIQREDNTFEAAEWTLPRRLTDATAEPADNQTNSRPGAWKFMALGIGLTVYLVADALAKKNYVWAILCTLLLLRGYQKWKNSPRFLDLRGVIIGYPIFVGLMILAFFNWHQYLAHVSADAARMLSAGEILTFNLIVTLAYAALIGFLIWKRSAAIAATSPK